MGTSLYTFTDCYLCRFAILVSLLILCFVISDIEFDSFHLACRKEYVKCYIIIAVLDSLKDRSEWFGNGLGFYKEIGFTAIILEQHAF